VGTPFAFCRESGILPELRSAVVNAARQGEIDVLSDALASPTGFPFKVVQLKGTLSEAAIYESRLRSCDFGYLRNACQRSDGGIGWRCPAERENAYVAKGGKAEEVVGRKCLCAGLAAAVGLGAKGEPYIVTAGQSVRHLADYLRAGQDSYSARDVITRILGLAG
jgi:nitronate monooxygenase